MGNFHYFMPTDCYFGRGCVAEHKAAMAKLGKKAMVVTGKPPLRETAHSRISPMRWTALALRGFCLMKSRKTLPWKP